MPHIVFGTTVAKITSAGTMNGVVEGDDITFVNGIPTFKHSATKNAETTNTSKTGDESNFALWIALLFISGGVGTGTAVFRRKKKFPENCYKICSGSMAKNIFFVLI